MGDVRDGAPGADGAGSEPARATPSPRATTAKPRGKLLPLKVVFLDDSEKTFEVSRKANGQALLNATYSHLNLSECDYFSLEFVDRTGSLVWLDPLKTVVKQVKKPKNTTFKFAVKFFPPEPGQLHEELTKYLFTLQIRRDLLTEQLVCSDNAAAAIASYFLQAEVGDCDESVGRQHLEQNKFLPTQETLAPRILQLHRDHSRGQSPAEADSQLLEIARRLDTYGVRLHPAVDKEGSSINLAVTHSGVSVFQSATRINAFNWGKIRKLSFKRKRFLIKFHPDCEGKYRDTLEFIMKSRDASKLFWKNSVEYHAFFRLLEQPPLKPKPVLFSRGSSFRYSGRTQRQLEDTVRSSVSKGSIAFERRSSRPRASPRSPGLKAASQLTKTPSTQLQGGGAAARLGEEEEVLACASWAVVASEVDGARPDTSGGSTPHAQRAAEPSGEHQGLAQQHAAAREVGVPQPAKGPVRSPGGGTFPPELSSPLLSPDSVTSKNEEDEDATRKRYPADKAYFVAKEVCTTERTHLKDLEVVTVWFRSFLGKDGLVMERVPSMLFANMDPLYEFHRGFLKEVEQRLTLWEGRSNAHLKGDHQRIGDIMLKNMNLLKQCMGQLRQHEAVLAELQVELATSEPLAESCRAFELQRVCYLPLAAFLLRPLQRPLHYRLVLERLCKHYSPAHPDFKDCRAALAEVNEVTNQLHASLIRLENLQKLSELQRDLVGLDNLASPDREFVREGCLNKLTRKGLQQRMFFLFSDLLIYTSRAPTCTNQFKVHGRLPLIAMKVRESEQEFGVPYCFTISTPHKSIVVAASSRVELDKWMEDIALAIELMKKSNTHPSSPLENGFSDKFNRSSDELSLEPESEEDLNPPPGSPDRQAAGHRANTTMQVCWHRNTSISMLDLNRAVENQLSGYLLRKFKNSSGWQKLWVVFTNFCLFFYKTHQDDFPLASLPLLGYSITVPTEADAIQKDYVFKLQFKSHIYFFRAESEYTFDRWMEVIRSATSSAGRTRLLSRKDSRPV
ncbi:LOW QUALITY PROTEIN: FERM, ARHGEF and pleckstrin domain-containing protein 1-like [Lethenteron reissneri]|uniref:LOW QUALITY PROTEIN: FERM, ARHGEF and pleckstrin domain-containing protein 1-like n=1 Tax=Lethenteron reissneri TaxID=7753 RepID=UPI002AB79A07|nr:LOW QUALITY PROTEIN: FERM, ARHGEF and pleckstrin domain-containing protein 1-like [Lethenteron reissneri]